MADWGIRVSKPGYDVKTCADYELVMSSSFNTLKTAKTGTAIGTSFVDHGLDYIPVFMSANMLSSTSSCFVGQNPTSSYDWTNVDINNINIYSGTVKYYIFYHEI